MVTDPKKEIQVEIKYSNLGKLRDTVNLKQELLSELSKNPKFEKIFQNKEFADLELTIKAYKTLLTDYENTKVDTKRASSASGSSYEHDKATYLIPLLDKYNKRFNAFFSLIIGGEKAEEKATIELFKNINDIEKNFLQKKYYLSKLEDLLKTALKNWQSNISISSVPASSQEQGRQRNNNTNPPKPQNLKQGSVGSADEAKFSMENPNFKAPTSTTDFKAVGEQLSTIVYTDKDYLFLNAIAYMVANPGAKVIPKLGKSIDQGLHYWLTTMVSSLSPSLKSVVDTFSTSTDPVTKARLILTATDATRFLPNDWVNPDKHGTLGLGAQFAFPSSNTNCTDIWPGHSDGTCYLTPGPEFANKGYDPLQMLAFIEFQVTEKFNQIVSMRGTDLDNEFYDYLPEKGKTVEYKDPENPSKTCKISYALEKDIPMITFENAEGKKHKCIYYRLTIADNTPPYFAMNSANYAIFLNLLKAIVTTKSHLHCTSGIGRTGWLNTAAKAYQELVKDPIFNELASGKNIEKAQLNKLSEKLIHILYARRKIRYCLQSASQLQGLLPCLVMTHAHELALPAQKLEQLHTIVYGNNSVLKQSEFTSAPPADYHPAAIKASVFSDSTPTFFNLPKQPVMVKQDLMPAQFKLYQDLANFLADFKKEFAPNLHGFKEAAKNFPILQMSLDKSNGFPDALDVEKPMPDVNMGIYLYCATLLINHVKELTNPESRMVMSLSEKQDELFMKINNFVARFNNLVSNILNFNNAENPSTPIEAAIQFHQHELQNAMAFKKLDYRTTQPTLGSQQAEFNYKVKAIAGLVRKLEELSPQIKHDETSKEEITITPGL